MRTRLEVEDGRLHAELFVVAFVGPIGTSADARVVLHDDAESRGVVLGAAASRRTEHRAGAQAPVARRRAGQEQLAVRGLYRGAARLVRRCRGREVVVQRRDSVSELDTETT